MNVSCTSPCLLHWGEQKLTLFNSELSFNKYFHIVANGEVNKQKLVIFTHNGLTHIANKHVFNVPASQREGNLSARCATVS